VHFEAFPFVHAKPVHGKSPVFVFRLDFSFKGANVEGIGLMDVKFNSEKTFDLARGL